ncbi:Gibberellin 2-beta-dioxygenase 1, variant 3, partial [Lathyrus oleraceus]
MVLLSKITTDQYPCLRNLKQTTFIPEIPIVDLSKPDAKNIIVKACEEFGFFKVVNHGVSMESISLLESEAVKFFSMAFDQKEKVGPANPFGYGNKKIGQNGDIGWVEYLLLSNNQDFNS